MTESLRLTAVFSSDENGWTMAQLAEWPAVERGRTVEEAREMLIDAAREMIASYHDEGANRRSAVATRNGSRSGSPPETADSRAVK